MTAVRVPASSANLGAGFDVLGMALSLYATVGYGDCPPEATVADERHPATIAFRRAGGTGPIWVHSPIPMGRGLGFSGAVRVGGAAAAIVQRDGRLDHEDRREVLAIAADLERHLDNAAASVFGGVVVAVDPDRPVVMQVPLGFTSDAEPVVVAWIPNAATTSTERSRSTLPAEVSRTDAVFNLGSVAMFVAACAAGDVGALRRATEDRLHQSVRLARVPHTAAALDAALEAGAWAAWLSGSGPTMAALCAGDHADALAAALPPDGHTKILAIDRTGVAVTDHPG